MTLQILNRICGDCKACCTACGVAELVKPMNVPCGNLDPQGCSIYETRPQFCQTFSCAWLAGDLPERYRPDQCGIVFWDGGQLPVQASLTRADIPLERVEYLAGKLSPKTRRSINGKMLSYRERPVLVIPPTLYVATEPNAADEVKYKEVKPGLFLAV